VPGFFGQVITLPGRLRVVWGDAGRTRPTTTAQSGVESQARQYPDLENDPQHQNAEDKQEFH